MAEPVAQRPKRSPRWVIVAAAFATVLAIAMCVAAYLKVTAEPSHTLTGTIRLTSAGLNHGQPDGSCSGSDGYDDMKSGATVVVRNESGKILATSQLRLGTTPAGEQYASVICDFRFTVDEVPKSSFYEVEVSHRGGQTYSFRQMQDQDWNLALTLG